MIARNVRAMQVLSEEIETCCANPLCKYPLNADRDSNFGAPGFGQVCSICHDMYTSVSNMNPHLHRPTYFKELNEAWLKELNDWKRKRKGMGD